MAYTNAASELFGAIGLNKDNVTANITRDRLTETALDITEIFQRTSSDCTNFNNIALYDCKVDDVSILQKGMCKLNIKSRMNTDVQNEISQSASIKAKQYAKDVMQSVSINPGSENAINIGKTSSNATARIQNRINEDCKNVATNINTFTCQNVDGLYGDYVAQDSIINSTVSCALSADIVNDTSQAMTAVTDQYASSTEDDALSMVFLGGVCIYIALIFNAVVIGSKLMNMVLLITAAALIIAIAGIYWYYKTHIVNNRPMGDRCADCTKYSNKGDCEHAACMWKGPKGGAIMDKNYPSLTPQCVCDQSKFDCKLQCYLQKDHDSCKNANCFWDSNYNICTGNNNKCIPISFN